MTHRTGFTRTTLSALALAAGLAAATPPPAAAQERPFGMLREQGELRQECLALRLERVLPRHMREHDVEM